MNSSIRSEIGKIKIECNAKINRLEIVDGYESKYYFENTSIPVLEVEIGKCKAIITSEINLIN